MTTLPMPMISQQTHISWDGSSPNFEMDCVPTCVLAGLMTLLDIKKMNSEWNPDHILDQAYPEGYKGGTDAAKYVSVCAKYGVHLFPVQGIPGDLVAKIHQYLAQGCPCIITEPDPYVPSSYGWTHVLIAYADKPGFLTFLDPWPGKALMKSDREWEQLLLNNQMWVMQKEDDIMPIDIHTPGVSNEFEEVDANHWKSKSTGFTIQYAILAEFKARGYAIWGLPRSPEIPLGSQYVKQHYDNCVVGWKEGKIALLPLYTGGPGTDPKVVEQQKNLAQLTAQLTLANQQLDQAKQQIDDLSHQQQPEPDPLAEAALALVRGLKPQLEAF